MAKKNSKKVTIYDLAEMAGVSTATISRVINGNPKVDYETRQNIIRLCNKHGYRPRLVKNKDPHVGLLIEYHTQAQIGLSPYLSGLISGAMEFTYNKKLDLSVILFESKEMRSPQEIVPFLLEKDVSGAIFVIPTADSEYIHALHKINFPYLVIGSQFKSEEIHVLRTNNAQGITLAVKHLHHLGHKSIGLISVDVDQTDRMEREKAFEDVMKQLELTIGPDSIIKLEPTSVDHKQLGYEAASTILQDQANLPTALVCLDDDIAIGLIKGITERGISVPEDISIVGFDDYPFTRYLTPPLTTIKNRVFDLGYTACETIEQLIRGRAPKKVSKILDSELIIRGSCAQPRTEEV